ncbi:MAG TPA: A/G-specific adenine glycosylase [Vicinamibacteria bacterium]|nr:A/G-specific adenine glycosylase [Vicinamibacteria bacterium]
MNIDRQRLLRWYRRHRRRLPWRERPEPYRVWVSELMLQQTSVKTVIPYFERFLARFPNLESLAGATDQEVLAEWSGLGYYERARALHRAAKILVRNGGELPDDVDGWQALPGVGRYTAGAIVSIAFGKKAPILDGNVARVLSRFFGIAGNVRSGPVRRVLWKLAEDVLPERGAGEINQALMELGALVCKKSNPGCLSCPIRVSCVALRHGRVRDLPETGPRPVAIRVTAAAALVRSGSKYLLFQRVDTSLMRDLWEFPNGECSAGEKPRAAMAREARERYGIDIEVREEVARVRHAIMNRRIILHAFAARLRGRPPTRHRWASESELQRLPVSSVVRKIFRAIDPEGKGKNELRRRFARGYSDTGEASQDDGEPVDVS